MCLCWSTLAHEIWALVSYWCWIAARVSVYEDSGGNLLFLMDFWSVLQVSKPSQEAYQNELNIESVERSFILSARSAHSVLFYTSWAENKYSLPVCSEFWCVLCSQLGYRERRVAGGHRQGHRRLHKEENNLHIKSESGGGKTINPCSCVFEHQILLNASMVTFSPSRFRRSALSTAGPR